MRAEQFGRVVLGACLVCLILAGCGAERRQVFTVLLPRSGDVMVEDNATKFIEVSDFLKMQGAESNSLIKVTFAPDVPGSRKGALVTQLRKAGFTSVKCEMTLDGKPTE
ncbi:hypothetical protein ACFLQU_05695 [Verrucomicrobiota bacterium]